ncbi:hypothetical protein T261_0853 [Streptomyces lydicus]|nr:hypothetical protein T261_0853 [Streptomyces lydicus]
MAFIDHATVVIGSIDDAHTIVVLNHPLRAAHRILTGHGFTRRTQPGRPLYLLPPVSAGKEAHRRAGDALHDLLKHTFDFVDLSWTTRWRESGPLPKPDAHFDLGGERVTATARSDAARKVLCQYGFQPTATGYTLPASMSEEHQVSLVTRAEIALSMDGLGARIALGFRTPGDIPRAPQRRSTPQPRPVAPVATAKPRTR